jgi:hypothetical protein
MKNKITIEMTRRGFQKSCDELGMKLKDLESTGFGPGKEVDIVCHEEVIRGAMCTPLDKLVNNKVEMTPKGFRLYQINRSIDRLRKNGMVIKLVPFDQAKKPTPLF